MHKYRMFFAAMGLDVDETLEFLLSKDGNPTEEATAEFLADKLHPDNPQDAEEGEGE
ncbi:hypothetical protein GF374_03400 [Candidatus Woesearchaeota archaeon]|nr:hypothetical protein [Candidatus Woesearchaeota archaeon]